jgi:hypothetical protein
MANPKRQTLTSPSVALETLEEAPRRALHMLVALATAPGPYALVCNRGYGLEKHARGWELEKPRPVIWTMEPGRDVFGVPDPFEHMRPRYHVLMELSKRLHADLAKMPC